ncbi:hypothetical protein [Nakamurella aerolata]|uniref:Uncharacterized protein n=1 Tax=Nakamurella aerolata TaxID=1656892 RepID=A0A849AL05_9ACTN|nr:hypothetical protein [Nakamurella aerolata]NNG37502.1 hypothetical protein [Nakamurella aerolata]
MGKRHPLRRLGRGVRGVARGIGRGVSRLLGRFRRVPAGAARRGPGDDTGGSAAGVREPRNPLPTTLSGAAARPLPKEPVAP